VLTDTGKLGISVPRDRLSTFDPQLIAKYRRRLPGFDEKIVSMYARGMTVREIRSHLDEIYGADVSPELISAVTDDILDEVAEWQNRPLENLYPLVFFDALRVKIRDQGMVRNKAVYVALGVRIDGQKEILGLWIEQTASRACWPCLLQRSDRRPPGLRWGQVPAQGHERAEESRHRGHPDRRGRRLEGIPGRHYRRFSAGPGSDLHRSPHP
jgi:transposase-like protein